ncbi:DUF1534 domain-containing protein [Pseudomonas caricapapayae]|nr:DUF1534 domain-containing protein [Pseudomonas caricapapayae]
MERRYDRCAGEHLSYLTLRRGNAFRDAVRHTFAPR